MRKPTNNWITCDEACHGYPALDFSWHISRYNYFPRRGVDAIHDATVSGINHNAGDCGKQVKYKFTFRGKTIEVVNCHFKDITVQVGQKIVEGTNIGTMGDTGKSNGVHLHFYMYESGKRVTNITKWLNDAIAEEKKDMLTKHGQDVLYRFYLGRSVDAGSRKYVGKHTFDQESARIRRSKEYSNNIKAVKAAKTKQNNQLPSQMR